MTRNTAIKPIKPIFSDQKYMSQDFQMTKPKDITRINVNHIGELIWWSYQFSTYPERLISIIQKVGNATEEVRRSLYPGKEISI